MIRPTFWGSDILINTTTADTQDDVKLASLGNGTFVAVWQDQSGPTADIRAQLFNADGSKRGGEFTVNKAVGWWEDEPVVTALGDGRFAVAWRGYDDADAGRLYGRLFNANGSPAGSDFLINAAAHTDKVSYPTITATAKGGFAVAYQVYNGWQMEAGDDLYTRAFDKHGHALSAPRIASLYSSYDQTQASTLSLKDGRYMVFYRDEGRHDYKVMGRLFNANGTPVSGHEISFSSPGDQRYPDATALEDGRVVVTWMQEDYAIKGQILNPNGSKSGGVFTIYAPPPDEHMVAAVTALPDGGFAVASMLPGKYDQLELTTFDKHGHRTSADMVIRAEDDHHLFSGRPSLEALPDGRLVLTWGEEIRGSWVRDVDVHAQIIDPRGKGIALKGTGGHEEFYGTRFSDAIDGASGNDRIRGEGGSDKLYGGNGKDVLWGGTGNDRLWGGSGKDVFVFDTAPNSRTNKDYIKDWNHRDDTILLDNAVFTALLHTGVLNGASFVTGATARDANDFVGYNPKTGDLWYDSNGSAAGGHVAFANIGAHKHIAYNDFHVI